MKTASKPKKNQVLVVIPRKKRPPSTRRLSTRAWNFLCYTGYLNADGDMDEQGRARLRRLLESGEAMTYRQFGKKTEAELKKWLTKTWPKRSARA